VSKVYACNDHAINPRVMTGPLRRQAAVAFSMLKTFNKLKPGLRRLGPQNRKAAYVRTPSGLPATLTSRGREQRKREINVVTDDI
jgi:hypothetical protein